MPALPLITPLNVIWNILWNHFRKCSFRKDFILWCIKLCWHIFSSSLVHSLIFMGFFKVLLRLRVVKGYYNPKCIFIFVAIFISLLSCRNRNLFSPIQIIKQKLWAPLLSPDNFKAVEGLSSYNLIKWHISSWIFTELDDFLPLSST